MSNHREREAKPTNRHVTNTLLVVGLLLAVAAFAIGVAMLFLGVWNLGVSGVILAALLGLLIGPATAELFIMGWRTK